MLAATHFGKPRHFVLADFGNPRHFVPADFGMPKSQSLWDFGNPRHFGRPWNTQGVPLLPGFANPKCTLPPTQAEESRCVLPHHFGKPRHMCRPTSGILGILAVLEQPRPALQTLRARCRQPGLCKSQVRDATLDFGHLKHPSRRPHGNIRESCSNPDRAVFKDSFSKAALLSSLETSRL